MPTKGIMPARVPKKYAVRARRRLALTCCHPDALRTEGSSSGKRKEDPHWHKCRLHIRMTIEEKLKTDCKASVWLNCPVLRDNEIQKGWRGLDFDFAGRVINC